MQVSRMTLKVGLGSTQGPRASLGFDKLNRLLLGHCLPAVFPVRTRQRGGKLEPNHFSFHYGCRIHGHKLSEAQGQDKVVHRVGAGSTMHVVAVEVTRLTFSRPLDHSRGRKSESRDLDCYEWIIDPIRVLVLRSVKNQLRKIIKRLLPMLEIMPMFVHVPDVRNSFLFQVGVHSLADADQAILVAAGKPEQLQPPLRIFWIRNEFRPGLGIGRR